MDGWMGVLSPAGSVDQPSGGVLLWGIRAMLFCALMLGLGLAATALRQRRRATAARGTTMQRRLEVCLRAPLPPPPPPEPEPDIGPTATAAEPNEPEMVTSVVSGCVWRRDGWREDIDLMGWTCAECGVEAYTKRGNPPQNCKYSTRTPGL